jgi:hypothetical protein
MQPGSCGGGDRRVSHRMSANASVPLSPSRSRTRRRAPANAVSLENGDLGTSPLIPGGATDPKPAKVTSVGSPLRGRGSTRREGALSPASLKVCAINAKVTESAMTGACACNVRIGSTQAPAATAKSLAARMILTYGSPPHAAECRVLYGSIFPVLGSLRWPLAFV